MKRRDFLKQGLQLGVAVNALPIMLGGFPIKALGRSPLRSALSAQSGSNNNVLVVIQLQGGNDGLNCLVPYGDPLYASLRPTLGLTVSGDGLLVLPDHNTLAFHAGMDDFLSLYNKKQMAILQNVGYANPILSHFRGTDVWHTATDSNIYASSGWAGRFLLDENPGYPPTTIPKDSWPLAMQIGNSLSNLFLSQNGGMGIAITQLPTKNNASVHLYDPLQASPVNPNHELGYVRAIQSESEVYTQTLVDILASSSAKPNSVDYATLAPDNTLATQLSYVAKCIGNGSTTKIYMVTIGSFDTHSDELTNQGKLLSQLSKAVGVFMQDLEGLGVADQVAILTYSEFGRRPAENGSGTDHGTAAPHFVIGTKVNGGVYSHDPDLKNLVSGNLAFDSRHDFRNVYATVMNEWLLAGGQNNMTEIDRVLTASNGATYSTTAAWTSLGLFGAASAVYDQPAQPGLMMLQNYPNPVVDRTTIEYTLPVSTPVQLSVYNIAGEEVSRPVDERQPAGAHRAEFNTGSLPSGMYLYRLRTNAGEVTQRMVVEK